MTRMDQHPRSADAPGVYRSLGHAAAMFVKAFPNRIASMNVSPTGPLRDEVGSAGMVVARELPLYGRNASSNVFEPIRPINMFVLSEDLTRAEHRMWPTAPGGTYTDLAVKVDEFNTYLHKEIRLNLISSCRSA